MSNLMSNPEMPSISIITAVLNSANTIGHCLESLYRQSVAVEHVVVDGGSTDGTPEIVKSYGSNGTKLISEPDEGIYDALNKGLAHATSEIVGILHADDVLDNAHVLKRISDIFTDSSVDACYGDLVYVDRFDTDRVFRYWRAGAYHPKKFYRGWMPPHPTFFVRRKIYEQYGGFNTALGTAADYELMLRFLLRHGISAAYLPETITRMRTGGQSNLSVKNRLKANYYDRRAWRINGLTPLPWTMLLKPGRKIGQYFLRPGRDGGR